MSTRIVKRRLKGDLLQPCSSVVLESNEEHVTGSEDVEGKVLKRTETHEEEVSDGCIDFGIPLPPSVEKTKAGVTFILEKASLTLAYVGKRYQILNPDEHSSFMRRNNMDPYDHRPDIVHEALHEIMDSRLCMAGRLRAVYIKNEGGHLIKVEPNAGIPKGLQSFCNMMAELLQKLSIKAVGGRGKLLRLVENPVTKHIPPNACKVGLSFSSPKTAPVRDYVAGSGIDQEFVFVVGAMAHGKIECHYIDDLISVAGCHLSAATCLKSICTALERKWQIL